MAARHMDEISRQAAVDEWKLACAEAIFESRPFAFIWH